MNDSRTVRRILLVVTCGILGACGPLPERDIGSADQPIVDDAAQISADAAQLQRVRAGAAAELKNAPVARANQSYALAELIDIAQRRNPATRQAWVAAREAGREAGVIGSALAPVVTLSAVAGKQSFDTSRTFPLTGTRSVPADAEGAAIVLTANWLLFDFGENKARQDIAQQISRIAELGFSRVHQQIVYDVTIAYHARVAALNKLRYARLGTDRANSLISAAERRKLSGLGNEIEVAQARQLAAQTRFILKTAEGQARAAAVGLAALLAMPVGSKINVSAPTGELPTSLDQRTEQVIESAFLRRTDVRAALAQIDAAEAEMEATAASYLPKVFAGGYASTGSSELDVNGIIPIGLNNTGSQGLFVGVTVPIYDGRIRESRLQGARDRIEQSRAGVQVAMLTASREIAIAYEALQTALALRNAARELKRASRVTYDATKEAYEGGIGTTAAVSIAALGLLSADEAVSDATRDAYQAAATLALAAGQ